MISPIFQSVSRKDPMVIVPDREMLVLKYQRKLGRLLSRFVRDAAEVEDVTQEAFIKAYADYIVHKNTKLGSAGQLESVRQTLAPKKSGCGCGCVCPGWAPADSGRPLPWR